MPDAAVVAIHAVARGHRDPHTGQLNELQLRKTWTKYAEAAGIEIQIDPAILAAEKQRALKAAMADFGYDEDDENFDDD